MVTRMGETTGLERGRQRARKGDERFFLGDDQQHNLGSFPPHLRSSARVTRRHHQAVPLRIHVVAAGAPPFSADTEALSAGKIEQYNSSCCTCRLRSHKYSESVFCEGSGSHRTWGLSVVSSVPCTGEAMRRLRRPHVAALGVGMAARVGAFVAPSGHILILSETRSEASAPVRTCQRSRQRRHFSMSQVQSSWSGKEQGEGNDDQRSFWDTAVEVSVTCDVCAPGRDTLMVVRFTTFNSRFWMMYTKSRNCHRYNTEYLHILYRHTPQSISIFCRLVSRPRVLNDCLRAWPHTPHTCVLVKFVATCTGCCRRRHVLVLTTFVLTAFRSPHNFPRQSCPSIESTISLSGWCFYLPCMKLPPMVPLSKPCWIRALHILACFDGYHNRRC